MVHKLYSALLKILQKRENMLNRISNMNGRFASAFRAFLLLILEKSALYCCMNLVGKK